jgi:riboflavin synthase
LFGGLYFKATNQSLGNSAVFTGIIEEVGVIREMPFPAETATVAVSAKLVMADLNVGDSICVDGVCLTATRIGPDYFVCDISSETLRRSNFKQARQGAKVNLERSLMVGERLGGHYVLGHVDDVGRLAGKTASGHGYDMVFNFPGELGRYMVFKGSIAINGISLTIASLQKGSFAVSVIPHTYQSTNLNQLRIGDPVNLEVDVIGKYFERFFQLGREEEGKSGSRITAEYLKDQGF